MKSSIPMTFGSKNQYDFSFSVQRCKDEFYYPDHWHDCFEVVWVKEGAFGIRINSKNWTLSEGSIVVIPPGTIHGTHSVGEMHEIYVYGYTPTLIYNPEISIDNMKYLIPFRHISSDEDYVIKPSDHTTENLYSLMDGAMKEYNHKGFEREIIVRSEILRLHSALCASFMEKTKMSKEASSYITDAQLYIEKHITEDISPYDIAKELHISYSHFARVLKSNLGCNANELIGKMKTSYAQQLMTQNPKALITEIAALSGFNSPSYFSRMFCKIRGCTPTEFRRMLRGNVNLNS